MSKCKTIGIISIKGGVGKTTAVINLASSLAKNYRKNVLVIDANFSSPNIGLHIGSVNHNTTIHDVLRGKSHINKAIYSTNLGFHYIPASFDGGNNISYGKLKSKISSLKKHYDYIFLDSSPSINEELGAAISASDELFVISSPDLPTLSTTLRAVRLAKDKGMQIRGVILNKVRGKKYELTSSDMSRLTGIPVVSILKDNIKVLEALSHVRPVIFHSPYSPVALGYKKLAALISGENYAEPSFFRKVYGYLVDDFNNFKYHKFSNGFKYY